MVRHANSQGGSVDVAVVGGGLAGLATAAYLGRSGLSVEVLEKASTLGGRAATDVHGGFSMNRGPHALYRKSDGLKVLRELGVSVPGKTAPAAGVALRNGSLLQLPSTPLSLFTTGLLGLGAKATVGRWMQRLPSIDATALSHESATAWLDRMGFQGEARGFFEALFRLTTYTNAPDSLSAETAIRQLQRAMGGVLYVDGGWQTLVDGLAARATSGDVRITPGQRAVSLMRDEQGVTGVVLADGRTVAARAVVLATSPEHAAALIETTGVRAPASMKNVTKVPVATLDIGLRSLPAPAQRFVLGIDQPLYLSVHSGVAKLGPDGSAMIHVSKYLGDKESDPGADRQELEALLDLAQPGWRKLLVHAQYLPHMIAAERLDRAEDGGEKGRPASLVAELNGVHLAGDWVQGGSFLADASLGSARAAAQNVLTEVARLERRRSVA